MSDYTVYLVEDHAKVRQQICAIVTTLGGLRLVGEADSAEVALEELKGEMPSLVLVDVSLPGMSGIELVKHLHERHRDCRCLMVSGHISADYLHAAKQAGAKGFAAKGDPDELLDAVECVLGGKPYWTKESY